MKYYSLNELKRLGVKILGNKIFISKFTNIYNPNNLILHNNIRIDDFCILSGKGTIEIKNNVHIGPYSFITSGKEIIFNDFSGLSSGCKLFGSSDDYSGKTLTNPTVPKEFLGTIFGNIVLEKHVILGCNSTVLPNVILKEGTATGVNTVINKNTEAWKIYAGSPGKIIKDREKDLLVFEDKIFNK